MSRRRSRDGIQIIYWRDIPAQLTANANGETYKELLSDRFQVAIDRAAHVAGLTETKAYVGEWRKEARPVGDEPAAELVALAATFEETFPRDRLEALVANGGQDPNPDSAEEPT